MEHLQNLGETLNLSLFYQLIGVLFPVIIIGRFWLFFYLILSSVLMVWTQEQAYLRVHAILPLLKFGKFWIAALIFVSKKKAEQ